MRAYIIEARRTGYSPDQCCYATLTLGELADVFAYCASEYGEDTPVYLSHDNGYTYGEISLDEAEIKFFDDDGYEVTEEEYYSEHEDEIDDDDYDDEDGEEE